MKKTKTFVAGMSLLLVLGLAGCGAEVPADSASVTKPDPIINVIPVDKTVKVEVGEVEGASVVLSGEGKQADGSFLPGSKAIAEITVTAAGKIVDWVDVNGTRVEDPDGDGKYEFFVPNSDCTVSVTLAEGLPVVNEIAADAYPSLTEEEIANPEAAYKAFEKLTEAIKKTEEVNQRFETGANFSLQCESILSEASLKPFATPLGFSESKDVKGVYEVGSNDVMKGVVTYTSSSKTNVFEFENGKIGTDNFYRSQKKLSNSPSSTTGQLNVSHGTDSVDLQRVVADDMTAEQGFVAADMTRKSEAEAATKSWIGFGLLDSYLNGGKYAFNSITKTETAATDEGAEPAAPTYAFLKEHKLKKFESKLAEDKKSVVITIEEEYNQRDASYKPYFAKRILEITIDGSGFLSNVDYSWTEFDSSKGTDGVYNDSETSRAVNTFHFDAQKGFRKMEEKVDMTPYCLTGGYSMKFNYKLDVDGKTKTIEGDGSSMQVGGSFEISSYSSSPFVMTPLEEDAGKPKFVQPIFLGLDDAAKEYLSFEPGSTSSKITAKKIGQVTLRFDNGLGYISEFPVKITDILPYEISASLSTSTLFLGDSATITASISPKQASQDIRVVLPEDDPTKSTIQENVVENGDGTTTKTWTITPTALGQSSVTLIANANEKVTKTLEFGVYEKPTYEAIHKAMLEKSFGISEDFKIPYQDYHGTSTSTLYKQSYITFSDYEEGKTYGTMKFAEKKSWGTGFYEYTYYYQMDPETLQITLSFTSDLDANGKLDPSTIVNKTSLSGMFKVQEVAFITESTLNVGVSYYSVKDTVPGMTVAFAAMDRVA